MAHFIPIGNIVLPTKARQFRRVNEEFVSSLEAEMEKNPAGSYGALFVVAKEITSKDEWKLKDKDSHTYEVLGGTHLSLATKRLHEKQPNNPHFAGRMCRIYVGLSVEQAVYLGGMHQQSSMFQHEITYREEVRPNLMSKLSYSNYTFSVVSVHVCTLYNLIGCILYGTVLHSIKWLCNVTLSLGIPWSIFSIYRVVLRRNILCIPPKNASSSWSIP